MRTPRPLGSWLWPPPAAEPSLASWRSALTAYTLRVVLLGAALTLGLVLASFWQRPPSPAVWRIVAVFPVTLALLALSWRAGSPRLRTTLLLAMFLGIAPLIFTSFGPSGAGFTCLLLACVLAAVLIGPRAATAFIAVSALLVLFGAAAHERGWGNAHPHPAAELAGERLVWFRLGVFWLSATGWLVFVTSWLTARFESAMRQKEAAQADAQHAGAERLASDQQRVATESALIEAQKHEAMGRIAGGVSHDFNNALFVILGWNDLLSQGGVSEEQRKQGHAAIASAGRNAAELAKRLVAMGRGRTGPPHRARLKPLLEEGVQYLSRLLPDDIRVVSSLADVPAVSIDPSQVQQVLLNLALNARDAMPDGGVLEFTLKLAEPVANGGAHRRAAWVEIAVPDTGHGMDQATRERLFEPWFTTKPESGGTGLGLTTTQAIVRRAHGRIEVESEAGRGSLFRVLLPICDGAPEPHAVPAVPPPSQRADILVVEDDPAVRELIVLALRSHGHRVRAAADGDEAMRLLDDDAARDALLCIDGVLPGAPSTAIIERFRTVRPGCPVLVCSGNLGSPQLQALVQDERLPFLPKPFSPEELAAKVEELLLAAAGVGPRV